MVSYKTNYVEIDILLLFSKKKDNLCIFDWFIKMYIDLTTNHNLSRLDDFDNFIQQYQSRRPTTN